MSNKQRKKVSNKPSRTQIQPNKPTRSPHRHRHASQACNLPYFRDPTSNHIVHKPVSSPCTPFQSKGRGGGGGDWGASHGRLTRIRRRPCAPARRHSGKAKALSTSTSETRSDGRGKRRVGTGSKLASSPSKSPAPKIQILGVPIVSQPSLIKCRFVKLAHLWY